jgi:glutamine amidotransferase
MIGLIDYGLGNLQAFANIYRRLGIEAAPARTPEDLKRADKIILPGVGAFDWAMTRLNESGLRQALDEEVLEHRKPILGVCVGMQMMGNRSDEGVLPGLGWIDAEIIKFDVATLKGSTHLPHMGWNDVVPAQADSLFKGLENPRFYFLHSYFMVPANNEDILATSEYGARFVSAVAARNIFGTQFHPEKSHHWGIGTLRNFAAL